MIIPINRRFVSRKVMSNRSINPERLLLESEKYLDEAHDAYANRDLPKAEHYLFLAADRMERLLPVSPPELVEARLKAVEEIGDFIEQIRGEIKNGAPIVQIDHETPADSKKQATRPGSERPLFSVEEKPAIKLDDVAGMDSLKELIRTKLIYPARDPETTRRYGVKRGAGILLYGPPGTGKSMIARAIAGEFDAAFISIKASDVLDCLYGQTEKNIAALFTQARKYPSAVVFIDELDGLGADRDNSDSHMRRFINQLLVELQGFSGNLDNLIVMGATNKPWLLDKALIRSGRLDEMFYVPLPDEATRREIWRLNLENKIKDGTVDIDALTGVSEGLSGADIARVCAKANTEAYRKAVQTREEVPITQADLLRFFPREPAQLHRAELAQLESFGRLYDRNLIFGPTQSRQENPARLCWDQAADVEAFWKVIFTVLPSQNGTSSEVAHLCQGKDFAFMAGWLAKVLQLRADPKAKCIEPICLDDFQRALEQRDEIVEVIVPISRQRDVSSEAATKPLDQGAEGRAHAGLNVLDRPTLQQSGGGKPAAVPPAERSDVQVPEILAIGQDLIQEFGQGLGPAERKAALDALYKVAEQCPSLGQFDSTAFVTVILELQDRAEAGQSAAKTEILSAEFAGGNSLVSEPDRMLAMKIISEHRRALGDSWKGFVDEIRAAKELNLDEFRQRVGAVAEEQTRRHEKAEFERLFEERKPFMDAALIAEIEAALASGQADIGELSKKIGAKSYEHFVWHVLEAAAEELSVSGRRAQKLNRKAFRKITRQRLTPTHESARNLLHWLDKMLRTAEDENRRKSQHKSSAAAALTDVKELIIPPGLVDFSDVAGMSRLKDQLEDAMDLCLDPRKREVYLRKTGHDPLTVAMLLYGAPGTGKSFMALAAAGEFAQKFNFTVMHVPHDAIRGLHYTRKLTRIREVFELARKSAPTLVVWDEFDELATPPRFSGRKYDAEVCATLKQEFEGAVQCDKIVLHLATSNHPWQVDPALLRDGRIGSHVHVLPPDMEARKEFWMLFTENAEVADDLDFNLLACRTEGMTVAEIREIYKAVSADVVRAVMQGNSERKFENADFEAQIEKHPPRHFRTWIAEAAASFKGRYASQRELFPALVKDIECLIQQPIRNP